MNVVICMGIYCSTVYIIQILKSTFHCIHQNLLQIGRNKRDNVTNVLFYSQKCILSYTQQLQPVVDELTKEHCSFG